MRSKLAAEEVSITLTRAVVEITIGCTWGVVRSRSYLTELDGWWSGRQFRSTWEHQRARRSVGEAGLRMVGGL
jgi:hypothetical protein